MGVTFSKRHALHGLTEASAWLRYYDRFALISQDWSLDPHALRFVYYTSIYNVRAYMYV